MVHAHTETITYESETLVPDLADKLNTTLRIYRIAKATKTEVMWENNTNVTGSNSYLDLAGPKHCTGNETPVFVSEKDTKFEAST
jgi:hypothetical protein